VAGTCCLIVYDQNPVPTFGLSSVEPLNEVVDRFGIAGYCKAVTRSVREEFAPPIALRRGLIGHNCEC
jgi:hypothetical protein